MKNYITLAAAAALLASPAVAQSNDTNLETPADVWEGARQSQEPTLGPIYEGPIYGEPVVGPIYEGRSSAVDPVYEGRSSAAGETNDSNLETQEDVLRGAAESADPDPMGFID